MTAILDWEGAHLGDPVEDLGWLCVKSSRFGAVDKPAAGFGSREECGPPTNGPAAVRSIRRAPMVGSLRHGALGIICHAQAFRHLSGAIESMELASMAAVRSDRGRSAAAAEERRVRVMSPGSAPLQWRFMR